MVANTLNYARDETNPFYKFINRHRKKIVTAATLAGLYVGFEIGSKALFPPHYSGVNGRDYQGEITYVNLGDKLVNTPLHSLGVWVDLNFLKSGEEVSTLSGLVTAATLGAAAGIGSISATRRRYNLSPEPTA